MLRVHPVRLQVQLALGFRSNQDPDPHGREAG